MIFFQQDFKNYNCVDSFAHFTGPDANGGVGSQMTRDDLAFLVGILDMVKPKKVLEVGVAEGGTTSVILDVLNKQKKNAFLYSVDLNERYYVDNSKATGHLVDQVCPELKKNWSLQIGNFLPAFINDIGDEIDLLILDTVHLLPGELLDFFVALPFLKDGAWVILHDINLPVLGLYTSVATKVLFDTVVAEKAMCIEIYEEKERLPNIGAFKVSPETRKHILNCFLGLTMPWSYMLSSKEYDIYKSFFEKYYDSEMLKLFNLAYEYNTKNLLKEAEEKARREARKNESFGHRILRHLKARKF